MATLYELLRSLAWQRPSSHIPGKMAPGCHLCSPSCNKLGWSNINAKGVTGNLIYLMHVLICRYGWEQLNYINFDCVWLSGTQTIKPIHIVQYRTQFFIVIHVYSHTQACLSIYRMTICTKSNSIGVCPKVVPHESSTSKNKCDLIIAYVVSMTFTYTESLFLIISY